MYYVCQIRNNLLGTITQHDGLDEAIAEVKQIVEENGELTEDAIAEIDADWFYLGQDADWSVCIGATE